jgi:hypothetical protein
VTTLCTFPGRAGDILWALPTVRAISQALSEPVGLQIAGEFTSLAPVLRQQPYLKYVIPDPRWALTPPDEWQAPPLTGLAGRTTGRVLHLGYRGWPPTMLAQYVWEIARLELLDTEIVLPPLDLETPWLAVKQDIYAAGDIAVGFTEHWFELKYGLVSLLLRRQAIPYWWDCFPEGRWTTEGRFHPTTWREAAERISSSHVFLGCCSAPHVLAVALGVPAVIVEPCEARHNPIFYPVGKDGPQVTLVKGLDGNPTFDARHVAETLQAVLKGVTA